MHQKILSAVPEMLPRSSTPKFLDHPGSGVAAKILRHDWSKSLGSFDGWPVSLKTTLATMLSCPSPMFLAWGPDLICFYNDSYEPILGYRASNAIGEKFGVLWESVWSDIEPMVKEALAGGSPTVTDMKLDLSRAGVPEESYWSFSYSPAYGDDGTINGMLCVTGETTARVVAEQERREADERLELALSAGDSIGTWDWDVSKNIVTADARFASLYNVEPERAAKGAPIDEFFRGIHPDDLRRVKTEIDATIEGQGKFKSEYRLVGSDGRERWVTAQGRAVLDNNGVCVRFPGISFDITERKTAELGLRSAKEERDFVVDLVARQRLIGDPVAVITMTSEALAKQMGANRVGFYRLLGSDRMLHSAGAGDNVLPPLLGEIPVSEFGVYAESERSAGRTLVFGDSRFEQSGRLKGYADHGVLSGICVPLMEDGRWSAGIFVHGAAVRAWSSREIALVKEIAGLTWLAVERSEALLRLKQRVDRQEAALDEAAHEIATQSGSRAEAESQLRQLQKMDAVGQLTGGIAHDFNNMLAIIIGGLNLTKRRIDRADYDVGRFVESAMEGATRAAALTQRLLAFSRQQPLSPEAIDLNKLISGLTDLLGRSLGETVHLETVLGAGLWLAKVDANQLENVLVNLAVNARDAMPQGGRLTIETANIHVDDQYGFAAQIEPGQYLMVAVTDTGTGMSPDVLAKAFDPFFTTKGVGKGTGLGLSQVYGFLRQSDGHVRVYSELDHGTTVKLYLPRTWGDAAQPNARRPAQVARGGKPTEIVLVVEDEDRVRRLSVETLRELGYTAIHAANGPEALAILKAGQDVTLLFTDIVMPEMTGRQLVDRALAIRPALKVIYTTGYTKNAVVHNGVIDPDTNFLAKPFSIDQLAIMVRDVLDNK